MMTMTSGTGTQSGRSEILELGRDEIILLTDRVRNDDGGTEDMRVCAYPLLLKLGSAYLEAVRVDGRLISEVPIAITEPEGWLLRSKVSSSDKTSNDSLFGVKLLRKIYTLLMQHNTVIVPAIEMVEVDKNMAAKAISEWRKTLADTSDPASPDPNDGADDRAHTPAPARTYLPGAEEPYYEAD